MKVYKVEVYGLGYYDEDLKVKYYAKREDAEKRETELRRKIGAVGAYYNLTITVEEIEVE